jgi:PAS domain S-box-containing protein
MGFSKRYIFIPIISALFFGLFYIIYNDIKEKTIREFNNEQLILAETAAQGITSFFNDCKADLTFINQLKDIVHLTDTGKLLMASFFDNHKSVLEAMTRVDENGIILYTYPPNPAIIGKDISYQKHVKDVMSNKVPVVSDVFLAVQGYLAIAIHVPVFDKNKYTGSMALLIPIDRLGKQYIGRIKIKDSGNAWLLSENGVEIYCPIKDHIGKSYLDITENHPSAREFIEKTNKDPRGFSKSIHHKVIENGKQVYVTKYMAFYRVPLGNTFWSIVISFKESDVYIALAQLRNRLIVVFLVLLALTLYHFYSLTKVRYLFKEETRRKKAEATLRKAEEDILMHAQALRSIKECVSITDMHDVILYLNDSFLKTYGYEASELIGNPMDSIRSEANATELTNEILPATIRGGWKGELINKRKNGIEFPISLSTTVIRDKNDNPIGLVGVASDITESKRIEKELIEAKEKAEESDRLKSAFLANMSHEIRTPMNGILGFASLLKEPGLNGEARQKFIDIIEKSGERMLNIINDLIDISKIEAGQMEVFQSATNINNQIEFICAFFKPEAQAKGISLTSIVPATNLPIVVTTDQEKLYAILTNLVKNAIKYSNSGSIEVGVSINKTGTERLDFYVKDTGIGIPIDRQEAVFKRFVQADIEDRDAKQGAGLGLAITKAYVEMLGGKIWLESKEGLGSTFNFTIPYQYVESAGKGDNIEWVESHPITSHNKKLVILIAEDDEVSESFIEVVVKGFSKETLIVRNGADAVKICQERPDIDLILMDMMMPGMSGYEATRNIRKFNEKVIIVAQTAFGLAGDKEKTLQAGCTDYLSKPLRKQELQKILDKYFA